MTKGRIDHDCGYAPLRQSADDAETISFVANNQCGTVLDQTMRIVFQKHLRLF